MKNSHLPIFDPTKGAGQETGVSRISLDSPHSFKNLDDQQIWEVFQKGHEGAFAYIYDHYFSTLYQYGCQLTRDSGVVEDLLQDLFVTLRLSRHKTGSVSCIKAYLLKSFRRKMMRHLKKKHLLVYKENLAESSFKIYFHHDMQFMQMQFREEQQKYIARLLDKLTPREREAVYHFYFENLDYSGIAQVMGLSSAKSARNLIYKALSCLKRRKHLFPDWLQ